MAYYPYAQRIADRYEIVGPTGVRAVFNDPTDANYAGMVKEVSGLDSPEVRETTDDRTQQDGGVHGDFWYGRRTINLNGIMANAPSEAVSRLWQDRIQRSTNAMRGDATLSWKPANRRENWITNPSFEAGTTGWAIHGGASALTTGATGAIAPGTSAASFLSSGANSGISTLVGTFPVNSWVHVRASVRASGATPIQLDFTDNTVEGDNGSGNVAVPANTNTTIAWTAQLTSGLPKSLFVRVATTGLTVNVDNVMVTPVSGPGIAPAYFDGSMAGFYWQGNPHVTTSGDFIEMYTPVRRQQPLRFTGGWAKEFQVQLVSEWAQMFSTGLHTVSGTGVVAENQGSSPAIPTFAITGAGTPTSVSVTAGGGGSVVFTGLVLGAGETVTVDVFNHSANFTAGTRNGQSANRYIDFTSTNVWPYLETGNNTITRNGGGTLVTTWRDTWV